MKQLTQIEKVIKWLNSGKPLNTVQAIEQLNIIRLGAIM
jgi:hypothetical protein